MIRTLINAPAINTPKEKRNVARVFEKLFYISKTIY